MDGRELANAAADVPGLQSDVVQQVQNSDLFRSFVSRSSTAHERARNSVGMKSGFTSVESVRPTSENLVPCPASVDNAAGEMMQGALAKIASQLTQCAVGGPNRPPSTRPKKPARERSVNKKFRFRERQLRGPVEESAEQCAREPPQDLGGFKSTRGLTSGLPVRVIEDDDGIKAWCRHFHITEQESTSLLALQGGVVRILDIQGDRVRVALTGAWLPTLPVQIFTACTPFETLQNIAWRTSDAIPEPGDFLESVAALDSCLDPGADPETPSECVPLLPEGTAHRKVRRFRETPAVGWPGVHNTVVRQTIRPGKCSRFPPDGARIRGRLLEAVEICDGHSRRLVQHLPKDADFRLGDGEVCDMLECAVSRMTLGEIVGLCCSDVDFVQAGGPFGFESPLGRAGFAAAGHDNVPVERDPVDRSEHRLIIMFQLLQVEGADPMATSVPEQDRLRYAADRKEAGSRAFKAGRIRLARERYRRTANFISVCFQTDSHESALELLRLCWLNAAQCELCLKNHAAAKRYCNAVLKVDPENVKALFRRASASIALGDPELQAIEDLRRVVMRDSGNCQAKNLLRQVQKTHRQKDNSEQVMYRKACADLIDDFQAIKDVLDAARAAEDGGKAEQALRDLLEAMPRLTSERAMSLKLGKCLAALEATAPGGSALAGELAARALRELRKLVMSEY